MKHLILLFSILLLTANMFAEGDDRGYIVKVGDPCPAFEMTLTDGSTVSTKDFKGKVVMLQFTASWCSVCRKEMPHIESEIWERWKDNKNFALYGIDRDEPLETVVKFAESIPVTYPMALDPNADIFALVADRKAGITRNVIIDKDGKIVYLTRLFNMEEFNGMVAKLEELLK